MKSPQTADFTVADDDTQGLVDVLRGLADMLESGRFSIYTGGLTVTPRTIFHPDVLHLSKEGLELLSSLVLQHHP